jgi:hypothetical protein
VQYFTSRNAAPQVSLNTKQAKPPPPATHTIPNDLATPRALKAALNRSMTASKASDVTPRPHDTVEALERPAEVVGQKRPVPYEDDQTSGPHHIPTPKPRPPPTKRPKAAPNIFIPKANRVRVHMSFMTHLTKADITAAFCSKCCRSIRPTLIFTITSTLDIINLSFPSRAIQEYLLHLQPTVMSDRGHHHIHSSLHLVALVQSAVSILCFHWWQFPPSWTKVWCDHWDSFLVLHWLGE